MRLKGFAIAVGDNFLIICKLCGFFISKSLLGFLKSDNQYMVVLLALIGTVTTPPSKPAVCAFYFVSTYLANGTRVCISFHKNSLIFAAAKTAPSSGIVVGLPPGTKVIFSLKTALSSLPSPS